MLDYPLANGVQRLRFPPYCSHKLQSLDYVVYGMFKSIITVCVTTGCLTIPGEQAQLHFNLEILDHTFPKAMTPINIQFRVAGLVSVNRDVFDIVI